MKNDMAPDWDRDRLRPPLQELLPTNTNNVVLPPISTITSTLKPPFAYCHPPSHTSGPPPGFFHYPTATAPILHPRPLSCSIYAQQPIPNRNPANAEPEPGPAPAAQEYHKRKAISVSSYLVPTATPTPNMTPPLLPLRPQPPPHDPHPPTPQNTPQTLPNPQSTTTTRASPNTAGPAAKSAQK
jgi:hypothetical protein